MRLYVEDSYENMSKRAAWIVASQIILKPDSVLGLATGSTPVGMYNELVKMFEERQIDFSQITTFNLDEYYRLPKENENSYYTYMMKNLFNHINISKHKIHIPNGMAEDVDKECLEYEEKIHRAGGIDLQILGVGANAHIGFNEPGNKLNVSTHLVDLTDKTLDDNSRFFEKKEDIPTQAISMGVATIMKARRIILMASGTNKAEVIKEMTNGNISTNIPASILQVHSDVTLIIDKEAALLIDRDNM